MTAVQPGDWEPHWSRLRAAGFTYFDFLTVTDWIDALEITAHAVDPGTAQQALASTRVPAGSARVASIGHLYPGARWHEREAAEMFGVVFDGLADTRSLLLRTRIGAPPLLRSTVLGARAVRPWPGAAEPGGSPARRRQRPPGVPDSWLEER